MLKVLDSVTARRNKLQERYRIRCTMSNRNLIQWFVYLSELPAWFDVLDEFCTMTRL